MQQGRDPRVKLMIPVEVDHTRLRPILIQASDYDNQADITGLVMPCDCCGNENHSEERN
jgi:hypothetical protein